MDDKAWWLALHLVPGVGRITFKKLVESFGHPRQVMQATSGQLMRVSGIGPKIAQAITGFQAARAVERELRAAQSAGCQIITQGAQTSLSPRRRASSRMRSASRTLVATGFSE